MNKIIFMAVLFSLFSPLSSLANTDNEILCLAKNIYYEAGAEPLAGKKAVAQVTINRTNHPAFPSTVCGVVHQRNKRACQFSWVCEPRKKIHYSSDNWEQSLMVAQMFLTDSYEFDTITSDTLFFHEKHLPFNWKNRYKRVATIGNHIFYRKKNANQG